MPIFGRKNKQGNRVINLKLIDGVPTIPNGLAVSVTLLDEELMVKVRIGKNAAGTIRYEQITGVEYLSEQEIREKAKNVIGRAVIGGFFLGPLAAIVGGMSGIGNKAKKIYHFYLVLNYRSSVDGEIKAVVFEKVGATMGIEAFKKDLKSRCPNIPIPEPQPTGSIQL